MTEEVCEGVCMEKMCETTFVNRLIHTYVCTYYIYISWVESPILPLFWGDCHSTFPSCKTVTKTGECKVRWEEKCNDLPHEVSTLNRAINKKDNFAIFYCVPPGANWGHCEGSYQNCVQAWVGLNIYLASSELLMIFPLSRRQTTVCPPPSLTSCSKESSVSECWTPDTYDSDCQGTLCCFNGCADVCLPPAERSCHEVTETVEEPKTEIVMKPVCVPVPVEDCTQQVRKY